MEEYTPESQEEKTQQLKRWFQDNLRIIVSIIIVVAIAGGIYSYSNRGKTTVTVTDSESMQTIEDQDSMKDTSNTDEKQTTDQDATVKVSTASSSQETENSFVETAGKGDSLTTLARQATANYLEKNADSALTKEHKIYIEDYLRKNISHKGGVKVGTSVEFSKDLVQKAITQSKNLNEAQLKNLEKYSARVSNL